MMSPLGFSGAAPAAGGATGAVAWALTAAWLTSRAVPCTAVLAGASEVGLPVAALAAFSVVAVAGVEDAVWAAAAPVTRETAAAARNKRLDVIESSGCGF